MDLHTRLANGLHQLTYAKEANEWINSLSIVSTAEFIALMSPDLSSRNAGPRLRAATVRHGYPMHNPRLCWGCDGAVDEATLACDCFAPTKTRS